MKEPFDIINKRCNVPYIVEYNTIDIAIQDTEELICDFGEYSYGKPNSVAIYINKALKKYNSALENFEKINNGNSNDSSFDIVKKNTKYILDYYEEKISSIIFSYTALEAFLNISIPEKYEFKIKGNKKTEIYNYSQIERYFSTRDKIIKITPDIYNIENISNLKQKHLNK